MWHPNRRQWIAIWSGFVVAALFFIQSDPPRRRADVAPTPYDTFAWLTIAATVLLVWFLQSRNPPK